MTEQPHGRLGRPLGALPSDLSPALERLLLEMRRHFEESGLTMQVLALKTGTAKSRISEILRGKGRIARNRQFLDAFIAALGLDDAQRAQLVFLYRQAVDEAELARSPRREGAATELADCLAELRQKSGLSLREISSRLALMGSSVAKSSVERTFGDPDRSPIVALQVALVLLDVLAEDERGPAAERVFRAALGTTVPATPDHVVLTAATGSGKTHSALAALHASQAVPSDETVASLARILDLPVEELLALRASASKRRSLVPGRPISEWNPLELEVHPSATSIDSGSGIITELPPYIQRPHDRLLAAAVRDAVEGQSLMVVVTGSSSTGKTRACWEAVQPLAELGWRLWHPFNPTRPDALLEGIDRVAPRTVVWLNEAQHYLSSPEQGEEIAYALQRLLGQPERGPILVLGTIWPMFLAELTALPSSGSQDPHKQARQLLAGRTIFIPDTFNEESLRSAQAHALDDPRLAAAVAQAGSHGRITQFLAGAPQLLHRYEMTTPASRAILQAAMDASRLGVSSPLPHSFLTDAAIDYLDDTAYDMLTEDWAEQAFAELARRVAGGQGPLRRTRPRPTARPPAAPAPGTLPTGPTGASYRLADYLESYGRETRRFLCPPASFWHAGYTHLTNPEDLDSLADAASDRYRLKWAHHLRRRAAEVVDNHGLVRLARLREEAGDYEEAEHLARTAADVGHTSALRELSRMREEAGDREGAHALAQQAASHGDALALAELAWTREEEGDHASAELLAQQAAEIGDIYALVELARMRETSGDHTSAEALYRSAAEIGDSRSLLRLTDIRGRSGESYEAERPARQAVDTGNPLFLTALDQMREQAGDREGAELLAREAIDAGNPLALAALARMREDAGDLISAEMLYLKTADAGMAWLINPASRWPHGLDPDGAPTPPWE